MASANMRRCAGSSIGEQLILICCAALAVGLVASLFLRYGSGAWTTIGIGFLAFVALMGGLIYSNERRNRRERMRELERKRQAEQVERKDG